MKPNVCVLHHQCAWLSELLACHIMKCCFSFPVTMWLLHCQAIDLMNCAIHVGLVKGPLMQQLMKATVVMKHSSPLYSYGADNMSFPLKVRETTPRLFN